MPRTRSGIAWVNLCAVEFRLGRARLRDETDLAKLEAQIQTLLPRAGP